MAQKLVVWNFKGGVGKTSVALGISDVLTTKHRRRTLYIDLDPQANGSSALGYPNYKGESNITAALRGDRNITPLPVKGNEYLSVCVSNDLLEDFSYSILTQFGRDALLENALNYVEHEFDYVIIDCPPSKQSPLVSCALYASDGLLIPVDSGSFGIDNIGKVIDIYSIVRRSKPDLVIKGIVQNMFVKNELTSQGVREILEEKYPVLLLKTTISKSTALEQAQFLKQNLSEYKSNAKVYEELCSLAQELFYLV
jgi:chromosome partitioning protein